MSDSENSLKLNALGSSDTVYQFDKADSKILETFPSPFGLTRENIKDTHIGSLHIEAPEFTSLCPLTGQPDFAKIVIDYVPFEKCVESKSLKLYLNSFRNMGEFHESCVNRMAKDLIELMNPIELTIEGQFTPRGGIPFWPKVKYINPEFKELWLARKKELS